MPSKALAGAVETTGQNRQHTEEHPPLPPPLPVTHLDISPPLPATFQDWIALLRYTPNGCRAPPQPGMGRLYESGRSITRLCRIAGPPSRVFQPMLKRVNVSQISLPAWRFR